jgi:hypothetical protein
MHVGSSTLISSFAYRFDDSVAAAAAAVPPPATDLNQEAGGLEQSGDQSVTTGARCAKQSVKLVQAQRENEEIRGPWASPMHQLRLLAPSLNW